MLPHLVLPGVGFRDHDDPKVSDWIRLHDESPEFDVALFGVPLSKTSISHSAASRLPDAIRATFKSLTPYSVHHRIDLSEYLKLTDLGNVAMHLTDLTACQEAVEAAAQAYWAAYDKPLVVLGGDHSTTGASVLGMVRAQPKRYGIIHFDAHHDVRNLEDGGRHNGTPFRTILESEFAKDGLLSGSNIEQIGLRDFVNSKTYTEYAVKQGVTVVTARQTHRQGLMNVVQQAFNRIRPAVDAIYVSFDVDVLDQAHAPGVPAPSPGGLTAWESLEVLEWLGKQHEVRAMDIVCVDPAVDFRDLTTRTAAHLVMSFLTGKALERRETQTSGEG